MFNDKVFGENLKVERKRASVTQEQLAELADVAPQTISGAETGRISPHLDTVTRIANALNLSIDYLCGGSDAAQQKKAGFQNMTFADMLAMIDHLVGIIPDFEIEAEAEHIVLSFDHCPLMVKYFQSYNTMKGLLDDGTITPQIFQMWKDGAVNDLEKNKIEDYFIPF